MAIKNNKQSSKAGTPLSSSSINLKHVVGFNSSGGAGSPFVRPSTANLRRHTPLKKTRVVKVNEQNMYALVNEMYDLRNRSYFE